MNDGPFETRIEQQASALKLICERFDLVPSGAVQHGFRQKSFGTRVSDRSGNESWLKLYGHNGPSGSPMWTGEREAAKLKGLRKPEVIRLEEWQSDGYRWRAIQMALAQSPFIDAAAPPPLSRIDRDWFRALRQTVDVLSAIPANRIGTHTLRIEAVLKRRYGNMKQWRAGRLVTSHGDLHWANLTHPEFLLVDWEHWGAAPDGFDAATLLANSLVEPELFDYLRELFAGQLETRDGRLSLLFRYVEQLHFMDQGVTYPAERARIEAEAERLISQL